MKYNILNYDLINVQNTKIITALFTQIVLSVDQFSNKILK